MKGRKKGSIVQITKDLAISYSSSFEAPFSSKSGLEVSAAIWNGMYGQLPRIEHALLISFLSYKHPIFSKIPECLPSSFEWCCNVCTISLVIL